MGNGQREDWSAKIEPKIIDKGLTIAHDASEGARLWLEDQAMIDRHYIKSEIRPISILTQSHLP